MATTEKKSVFATLNAINANEHTEKKKQGSVELTYLSWAWAWAEVKKAFPNAFYTIYENADGFIYHTDGHTCWVKTGVTIEGLELIEYLPVMDFRNQSIPLENVTSFDVNKAIQRSLTKACARHGLGLYIYAGEDLPEEERIANEEAAKKAEEDKLNKLIEEVKVASSREAIVKIWNAHKDLQTDPRFKDAVIEAGEKFPKPQGAGPKQQQTQQQPQEQPK